MSKAVVLLGNGHVGSHLATAIGKLDGYHLLYHYTRSSGAKLSEIPLNADIYLFAISDTALSSVWQAMPITQGVWIHTAGSVSLAEMNTFHHKAGVLYPLQTFSKGKSLDWQEIPLYYEGHVEAQRLAEALSKYSYYSDSQGRKKLHLAAVIACNYSNYLVSLAEEYLQSEGFEPKAIMPLLREMLAKLEVLPARSAQTGPAIRGDKAIIDEHLNMLSGETREVYDLLSSKLLTRSKR